MNRARSPNIADEARLLYRDLLGGALAEQAIAEIDEAHSRALLSLLPMGRLAEPRFIARSSWEEISRAAAVLLSGIRSVVARALEDAELRTRFGLAPWEEELLAIDAHQAN